MQYNTFRQAQGIPMATTFCTNHIRQVGVAFSKAVCHPDQRRFYLKRLGAHLGMLFSFAAGGIVSAILCRIFLGKAVWVFFDSSWDCPRRFAVCRLCQRKRLPGSDSSRSLRET